MICTHGWNIGQAPEGYYYYYNTTTQGTCNTLNMAGLLNKPLIAIITWRNKSNVRFSNSTELIRSIKFDFIRSRMKLNSQKKYTNRTKSNIQRFDDH